MSDALAEIAESVRRRDPDRFLSAMTAPPEMRGRLLALYAFNLEIARVPFAVSEPMLGEIRLQWWRETVEGIFAGQRPRAHAVAAPLAEAVRAAALPKAPFDALIDARGFDLYAEPIESRQALDDYLDATSGGLVFLSARALSGDVSEPRVRDAGFAFGAANLIRALPALLAAGKRPLPETGVDREAHIRDLARDALGRLERAREGRRAIAPAARPALFAGWRAESALRAALRPGFRADRGPPAESEFRRRASLLARATLGRW